jgi:hypothetical protein
MPAGEHVGEQEAPQRREALERAEGEQDPSGDRAVEQVLGARFGLL